MIYHGECPVLKISIPCFLPFFDENHMKEMKKEIVLSLKPTTKTSQLIDLAGKSKEDVFRRVLSAKWPFLDGGLKVSLHGL